MGRVRERASRRRLEMRTSQKKEDAGARKGRKVAEHRVFPMVCGSGGSKSRLAQAAGAEPSGQMRDEKLHAVVARRTIPSQNAQNTSASEHFLKVKMSKKCTSLSREAHVEIKMLKYTTFRPLLNVQDTTPQLQLQVQLQLQLQLRYITLHYNTCTTLHYTALHYTNYTTLD